MNKRYFVDDKGKPSLGRKITWYSFILGAAICLVGTAALFIEPSQSALIIASGAGLAGIGAGGKAVSKWAETRGYHE